MTQDENLEQQYDDIIKYIDDYRVYVRQIHTRILYLPIKHPKTYLRLLKETPSEWRQLDLLSGKNSAFNKRTLTEVISDDDKASASQMILMTDYPLHALSVSLDCKFPDVDFEKLKQLHELKKSSFYRLSVKQSVGIVLATATILLKTFPQSVVARIMDYKQFELVTFGLACLAIFYTLLIVLPFWLKSAQAGVTHKYAKLVLEYTCIRKQSATKNKFSISD